MPIDPRSHFKELGGHVGKLLTGYETAFQSAATSGDPVALDKFAIHCKALAEALSQVADRATELAGSVLEMNTPSRH